MHVYAPTRTLAHMHMHAHKHIEGRVSPLVSQPAGCAHQEAASPRLQTALHRHCQATTACLVSTHLGPRDNVVLLRQDVHQFPFPFIAPLSPEDDANLGRELFPYGTRLGSYCRPLPEV